jgi:hypothetical protein
MWRSGIVVELDETALWLLGTEARKALSDDAPEQAPRAGYPDIHDLDGVEPLEAQVSDRFSRHRHIGCSRGHDGDPRLSTLIEWGSPAKAGRETVSSSSLPLWGVGSASARAASGCGVGGLVAGLLIAVPTP